MTEENKEERDEAFGLFQKAYECQMSGQLETAIGHYKKSIQIYATAEAYTFLGWTYSFMGQYQEAIDECHKAIDVDPDFGNPYNDIGAYLIELDQLDEAIPWLERATQAVRYDSYCFPHLNLGRVWEKKGEWDKAIEEYRKALEANPDYILAAKSLNRLRGMLN